MIFDIYIDKTLFISSYVPLQLWGAPNANETVADEEEELVAYCTTDKYGTRVIPPGALQGVQFITTPDYVEVVGYIDQTALNLQASDSGGEEDPHGADQRGNPLGSLLYSSAFNNSAGAAYTQVSEWSYFVGSGIFCFKACDPAGSRAAELCQHTYDRVGCTYNDPVDYDTINGTFTSCKGDDQLPVGEYSANGQLNTWYQPPESDGDITTVPYTPSIPATSQCKTYESSSIFTNLAAYYSSVSPGAAGATTTTAATAAGATGTSGSNASAAVSGGRAAANEAGSKANAVTTSKSGTSNTSGASKKLDLGSTVATIFLTAGMGAALVLVA